ncbi:MAG: hypothetical protein RLZZ550_172 [Verrucomicrobiota bacterium]|jgi:hypothetical protein
MRLPHLLLAMATFVPSFLRGTEEAYPRTPMGSIETKTLPAARLMLAESPKGYFEAGNGLFMKLFRYIDGNQIPMTAPVEARLQPGVMVFYMDAGSAKRTDLQATAQVKLAETPARLVAAIGVRGSYSRENFDEALAKLKAWLAARPDLAAQGEPYAVYWNSPFVPGIFKHSEVHIPVAAKPAPPATPAK